MILSPHSPVLQLLYVAKKTKLQGLVLNIHCENSKVKLVFTADSFHPLHVIYFAFSLYMYLKKKKKH